MKAWIAIVLVALAVIAASYAAVSCYKDKAAIARDEAAKAASIEEAQLAKTREAKELAAAERAKENASRENARLKTEERAAKEAAVEQLRLENENLKLRTQEAEKNAKAAADNAQAQADERASKEAALKTKKAEESAEAYRVKFAEEEAAKAEAQARKSEADNFKLRHSLAELETMKVRYNALFNELKAYERELDEREAALHVDLKAEDLLTLGDDAAPGEEVQLPENDKRLTKAERELARLKRLDQEAQAAQAAASKAETIARLESLMKKAAEEDRVTDVRYYYNAIKNLYPDWKYQEDEEVKE